MIVLGNIISFIGCAVMIGIGLVKKKEHILTGQCIQFSLQGIANLLLGAWAGFLSCAISVVRIQVFNRAKVTVWLKLGFIALQAVLTVFLGGESFLEWLPVLSMVLYTWYLDTDNTVLFKCVNMFGQMMWVVYDLLHRNYVAFAFDIFAIVSTTIGVILLLRDKKKDNGGSV